MNQLKQSLLDSLSIQLYTVKEQTSSDFAGTLKKLAEIGYTGVEFAGYNGITASEMRKWLDEYGLRSVGTHVGLEYLEGHLDEELAYSSILGTDYIIIANAAIRNKDDALHTAERVNALGEKCLAAGFGFAYHNHDHEFEVDEDCGLYLMDILYANLRADISMQLDIYWAAIAGVDYISYMKANKARLRSLHLKQVENYQNERNVDFDRGVIDFKEVIAHGNQCNVKHYIIEQEQFLADPFHSIASNFKYIMGL